MLFNKYFIPFISNKHSLVVFCICLFCIILLTFSIFICISENYYNFCDNCLKDHSIMITTEINNLNEHYNHITKPLLKNNDIILDLHKESLYNYNNYSKSFLRENFISSTHLNNEFNSVSKFEATDNLPHSNIYRELVNSRNRFYKPDSLNIFFNHFNQPSGHSIKYITGSSLDSRYCGSGEIQFKRFYFEFSNKTQDTIIRKSIGL